MRGCRSICLHTVVGPVVLGVLRHCRSTCSIFSPPFTFFASILCFANIDPQHKGKQIAGMVPIKEDCSASFHITASLLYVYIPCLIARCLMDASNYQGDKNSNDSPLTPSFIIKQTQQTVEV